MTQSLLSSWIWSFQKEDGYDDFLKTLNREKMTPNDAQLLGTEFEGCVNSVLDGAYIPPTHKWYKPVMNLADLLAGSQQQVTARREVVVDGVCFELYGVLDFLKAGIIYDTKFSKHYYVNKYISSPQHPLYFRLVPEAYKFSYLSCDGDFIYTETYCPDDVTPIETTIHQFMQYLEKHNLIDVYTSIWNLKTYYESKKKETK